MAQTFYSYFSSNTTSEELLRGEEVLEKKLRPSQISEFEYFKHKEFDGEFVSEENITSIEVQSKDNYSQKKLLVEDYYVEENSHSFRSVAKWEGVVIDFDNKEFSAELTDLKSGGTDEKATISIDEISNDDKKLINKGAVFYWHIGYEQVKGTIKKSSIIKFKRTPKWTKTQINNALETVKKNKDIKWD